MGKLIVRLCVVGSIVIAVAALVFIWLLPPLTEPFAGPSGKERLWHHACFRFYQEASQHIFTVAAQNGYSTVCLLPEVNQSNYMCSSPCNEGLALELDRWARQTGRSVELAWWDGSILTGFYDRVLFRVVPQSSRWLSGRWWKGVKTKAALSAQELEQVKNDALTVQILISDALVDKKTFKLTAGLRLGTREGTSRSYGPTVYAGSTKQIRWFVRKNFPAPALLSLIMITTTLLWPLCVVLSYFWRQTVFPTEKFVGTLCIVAGLIFFFAIAYAVRFDRRQAFYYKPNNLFFLVDRNSELLFTPMSGRASSTRAGPQYVVQNTCMAVLDKLLDRGYIRARTSFWQCFWSRMWLHWIYAPPKYELNMRWNPLLHFCSGREDGQNTQVGISAPRRFARAFKEEMLREPFYRESRLIMPAAETHEIAEKQAISEDEPTVSLLFTSACAPYEQEVRDYFRQINQINQVQQHGSDTKAFTVFLPTLPRTGSSGSYHFEEAKFLFASLGVDVVVQTNAMNYNLDDVLKRLVSELGLQWLSPSAKDTSARPQLLSRAKVLSIPIYQLKDLGSNHCAKWDTPKDLEALRTDLLGVKNPEKARKQCEQIAARFIEFADGVVRKEQEPEYTVHVLAANKTDMVVLIGLAVVLGFVIFCSQYNMMFLHNYLNERFIRLSDQLYLLLSLAALVLSFLFLLWLRHEPIVYAFRGWADVAFCGMMCLWLALFAAPFIAFRLYCWMFDRLWLVRIITGIIVAVLTFVIILVNTSQKSFGWRFLASLVLCVFPVCVVLLLERTRSLKADPFAGLLSVWRHPSVAFVGKFFLIALFALLAYGALGADTADLELYAFTIPAFWIIIGFAIRAAQWLTK